MKYKIPFNRPHIIGQELYYIAQSVLSGYTSGDGTYTKKCQKLMEKKFKAKRIMLTPSCTAALEMSAILCNIGQGDEVIMPSFTFTSTANAFLIRGAKIIFAEINPKTLNIDENQIETLITKKTKAIVVVHYAGISCDMDKIINIARKHKLFIIEDAAQAVNAKFNNRYLGTIGDIGTYSFHESKNFNCGEGGAIVINNPKLIERAEIIREKGTNRSKFYRGEIDKYTWVDIGSSYLLSDLLAAYLYAQLKNLNNITKKRGKIFNYYFKNLSNLALSNKLELPYIPDYAKNNFHIFYILLKNEKERNGLMDYLKSKSILAVFHYLPLHLSPVGLKMGYKKEDLSITEDISSRLLRLPIYNSLKLNELNEIIKRIYQYFK